MKVVTVCGMGFGTSLMLLMSVKESGRKYGITVEGEATDLGSYKGKSCDLIVASSEIAKQIEARSRVEHYGFRRFPCVKQYPSSWFRYISYVLYTQKRLGMEQFHSGGKCRKRIEISSIYP